MTSVVSINTAKREEAIARTASGETVTASDCEAILNKIHGYKSNLVTSETEFKITLIYPDQLPENKVSAFIVVNDWGFPFLLGYVVNSFGVTIMYNSYINPLLEEDMRNINHADVTEIVGDQQRNYQVALRHSFE